MIKIRVNPFFILLFFFALFHGFIYDVILLFVIVFIHELGHACTALSYGWRVREIELLPFGGVAKVDEHGNRPIQEEALVIIAGPLMNVIMIAIAFLFLQLDIWKKPFAYQFLEYNLIILLFNLIPIWPLDGGKLLQLIMSLFLPFRKAIRHSLLVSGGCFVLLLIIIVVHKPYVFTLWVVALFLLIAQWLEYRQSPYQYMRFLIERHQRKPVFGNDWASLIAYPEEKIKEVAERMFRHKFHYFCLINQYGKLINVINEKDLLDCYFTHKQAHHKMRDVFIE